MSNAWKITLSILALVAVVAAAIFGTLLYTSNKEYKPAGYDYIPVSLDRYEYRIADEYEILTVSENQMAVRYVYLDVTITNYSTKTIEDLYIAASTMCLYTAEDGRTYGTGLGIGFRLMHDISNTQIKGGETATLSLKAATISSNAVTIEEVSVSDFSVYYIDFAGFGGQWGDKYATMNNGSISGAPHFEIDPLLNPEFTPIDPPKGAITI